ncbi:hypothetical protein BH10BAC2_BH10BAC2_40850 [soil metagenome]
MKTKFLPISFLLVSLTFCTLGSKAQQGVTKYGANSLSNNTTNGIYNSAFGYYALNSNTDGTKNTATGANALRYNSFGNYNTANGYAALYKNFNGSHNVAVGHYSLFSNLSGGYNTAIGNYSLQSIVYAQASYNTAVGYNSLSANIDGAYNTAMGYNSLYANKDGSSNTAFGSQSLYSNTAGENTAIGYNAMYSNTVGSANTASGTWSMYLNKNGSYNTADGYYALRSNTSGGQNTAIGYRSLFTNTTGTNNTAIGYNANVSLSSLTNAMAIGASAIVDASNKVRIGNASVTSIGGQVGWTTFSDGRYKKDIREDVPGLAFINSLRPVTYKVDIEELNNYFNKDDVANLSGKNNNEVGLAMRDAAEKAAVMVHNGFIAQEVEEAAKKLNYNFDGVDKPQDKDGLYGLRYAEFVVPLVKAVQELSGQNEILKAENESLKTRLDRIEKIIIAANQQEKSLTFASGATGNAKLEQNAPNPFSSSTAIRYTIPASANKAQIIVTNSAGNTVKTFILAGKGAGNVTINANELSIGSYYYTLIVDGKKADSKKMVLIR